METSAKIDSRLIPECLVAAGLDERALAGLRDALAELLCAKTPSPLRLKLPFSSSAGTVDADVALELLWDGIMARVSCAHALNAEPALKKYSQNFDEAIQQKLKFETGHALLALDESLRNAGASLDGIRKGTQPIDAPVARSLLEFYTQSIDRVIHEEIVGLLVKPVIDKTIRLELGQFLLSQFPIPAKRVQRFTLCQALENLASPGLSDGLAQLALDKQYDSLRGRLCMALAKCGNPNATATLLSVLEDSDDETKMCAIEALGFLKSAESAEKIRAYCAYQSPDKEWTRAINKAAEKALKKIVK